MPRLKATKAAELEAFWRAHLASWRASDLNQREYCEAHGLPLKRFGNWRAKFKHEDRALPRKVLYRRNGGLSPMTSPRTKEISAAPSSYIPSARSSGAGSRRNFSEADKRRIVEEACREEVSVSSIAKKYGIAARVLFRWRKELVPPVGSTIVPVVISDAPEQSTLASCSEPTMPMPAPIIVERASGIEVELIGGRRVRFERDVDPETVRRLVAVLEGDAR
ncbi:IS66-like element accessory protein TnpA [Mesorhizobium shangrilense]|uniref:Transposase n=1 Tax=Mesorhizobium shangrilense TaxID=460060 RepID=A0ABV2DGL9_9HYPH